MSTVDRRDFLRSVGLMVVATAAGCSAGPSHRVITTGALAPTAWLEVGSDDRIRLFSGKSEMGQGIYTGFATIAAEELDVAPERIQIVSAPNDEAYDDPVYHTMLTGGSTSIAHMYDPLRRAGATARAMLIAAAAKQWSVDPSTCRTENGSVVASDGRRATYGSLAVAASALPVPADVALKAPEHYAVIGKRVARVDLADKVDGRAPFGIDVQLPGMKIATVVHPPVPGATLAHADYAAAKAVHGVVDAFPIDTGIAVVGDHTWAAFSGARALNATWNDGANASVNSDELYRRAEAIARDSSGHKTVVSQGSLDVPEGGRAVEALYRGPFLAHATMEPQNATVLVKDGKCDVWAPTQVQTAATNGAASAAGVSAANVTVHTTLLGGGFGRRLHADLVREAATIAKRFPGTPIKLQWTREEDTQHDYYRPISTTLMRGGLDAQGNVAYLDHAIVAPSILRVSLPEYMGGSPDGEVLAAGRATFGWIRGLYLGGIDSEEVQGALDAPYAPPGLRITYAELAQPFAIGDMRAPGANWNTFALESFIDELALAGKHDPIDVRRALMKNSPRARAVLDRAIALAGPAPAGRGRGVAYAPWAGSHVAMVAQVARTNGAIRVEQLWVAADIGRVVNPDNATAQIEGGALFGLSMALGKITVERGRIAQSNFSDYRVLRLADAPKVTVAFIDSAEPPTGVGEIGVPPVAPALANAIVAAGGERIRELPFSFA